MKRILVGILLLFLLQPLCLIAQEFSFYRANSSTETLNDVRNEAFVPFEEKVNEGEENGVYWLKFKNSSENVVCELTSAHLKEVDCFVDEGVVPNISGSVFPSFKIAANQTAFFRVNCDKEAFIPVKLLNYEHYKQLENRGLLSSGMYY